MWEISELNYNGFQIDLTCKTNELLRIFPILIFNFKRTSKYLKSQNFFQ